MIRKITTKGCCGNKMLVFETEKPLRKVQSQVFRDAGWTLPANFYEAGIFYAMKDRVFITGAYGTGRFNVRVSGASNELTIKELEEVLEKAVNT